MQKFNFKNINEVLRILPENQLEIVQYLREIIKSSIPDIIETFSSDIPYYKKHKGICYILPGAIPWGGKTWEGVEFGFQYGNLLSDEAGYLDKGNRKQVFTKRFHSMDEVDEEILQAYLIEANEIDEIMYRNKKK